MYGAVIPKRYQNEARWCRSRDMLEYISKPAVFTFISAHSQLEISIIKIFPVCLLVNPNYKIISCLL